MIDPDFLPISSETIARRARYDPAKGAPPEFARRLHTDREELTAAVLGGLADAPEGDA